MQVTFQYRFILTVAATHLLVHDYFDRSELLCPQNTGMAQRMNRYLSKYFRCDVVPIYKDTCDTFVVICRMYFELGEILLATGKDLHWVYQEFDVLVVGNVA